MEQINTVKLIDEVVTPHAIPHLGVDAQNRIDSESNNKSDNIATLIHPETGRRVSHPSHIASALGIQCGTLTHLASLGKIRRYGVWMDVYDAIHAVATRRKPGRPKMTETGKGEL